MSIFCEKMLFFSSLQKRMTGSEGPQKRTRKGVANIILYPIYLRFTSDLPPRCIREASDLPPISIL